jgi:hypothetical protein
VPTVPCLNFLGKLNVLTKEDVENGTSKETALPFCQELNMLFVIHFLLRTQYLELRLMVLQRVV